MESWTERVREEAKSLKDILKMTFEDENNKYVFHFADIKAYSYGYSCPDFDLFVDICKTGIGKSGTCPGKPVWSWNQALGNSLSSKPREVVPFGKEYYDMIYPKLYGITERELRANNEKLLEMIESW